MEDLIINSKFDSLELSVSYIDTKKPKAMIFFSHGMAEHKERYFRLMEYLANNGFSCIIHDHRGHGKSIKDNSYGDFYTNSYVPLVDDLKTVIDYFKEKHPDVDCYIFSHSMGTLVARCFMQKYDAMIKKIILCGAPTKNAASGIALSLAKKAYKKKPNEPANAINKLAFDSVNSVSKVPNGWLCSNLKEVEKYNNDPLCGFVFKPSGFIGLFGMMVDAFKKNKYQVENKELEIFLIGGGSDPIINGYKKFNKLAQLFTKVGYTNVSKKLYIKMRHEILNEGASALVFQDILKFYEE